MTCNDAFQAQIISGALENEGIPSVLHNVNTSYVLRGAISQIAGVDIFVYEADYNRALEILERNEMIPEQLKYCPRCHSDDIRFVLKNAIGCGHCSPESLPPLPQPLRARSIGNLYAGTAERISTAPFPATARSEIKSHPAFTTYAAAENRMA